MKVNLYQQTTRVFLGSVELTPGENGMIRLPEIGDKIVNAEGREFTVTAFSTVRNLLGEMAEAIVV